MRHDRIAMLVEQQAFGRQADHNETIVSVIPRRAGARRAPRVDSHAGSGRAERAPVHRRRSRPRSHRQAGAGRGGPGIHWFQVTPVDPVDVGRGRGRQGPRLHAAERRRAHSSASAGPPPPRGARRGARRRGRRGRAYTSRVVPITPAVATTCTSRPPETANRQRQPRREPDAASPSDDTTPADVARVAPRAPPHRTAASNGAGTSPRSTP